MSGRGAEWVIEGWGGYTLESRVHTRKWSGQVEIGVVC